MRYPSVTGLLCGGLLLAGAAYAQTPGGAVRIGILNDQSGPYADFGGNTSVDAARMAVADVGGKVLGRSIEIRTAQPGESVPGVPPTVIPLLAGFDTYETVFDTSQSARAFGVTLTPLEVIVRRQQATRAEH